MRTSLTLSLNSLETTERLARHLAACVEPPMTLALDGTLGTGKTQLVRYLVASLGGDPQSVTSPTYVLLQSYAARIPVWHVDFYRLESEAQVWDLGLDELFEQPCVVAIEWAEKFPLCQPDERMRVKLSQVDQHQRVAELSAHGPRAQAALEQLQQLYPSSQQP